MATPKVFTAADIKMGAIKFEIISGSLSIIQGYRFIDEFGEEILQLPKRTVDKNVLFTNLPLNIRQALIDITAFMYTAALEQEGME